MSEQRGAAVPGRSGATEERGSATGEGAASQAPRRERETHRGREELREREEPRERLRGVRGWIFDMDGTLALGDQANGSLTPLPGAAEVLRWTRDHGLPYVVFTNGTNRAPAHFASVLRDAGLAVPDEAMMTPASSAAVMFARRGFTRVMVLGGEGLASPLREAGIAVVTPGGHPGPVDAVLAGWCPGFTMPALEAAVHAVWDGAALYSASQTPFFATAAGRAMGTSRAISAMIASLTGCRVMVTGKPSPGALRAAAARLGVPARSVAVVGDDPLLEVPMAHRGKALAIAVDTGLGGPDAYDHLPAGRRPHLHLRGVDELAALLRDVPPHPRPSPAGPRGSGAGPLGTPAR
jgi:4-nitrophenyl phosphatase